MSVTQEQQATAGERLSRPIVRAVLDRDHQALHDLLTSRWVVEGTMRVPFAREAATIERISPRPGVHQMVAEVDGEVAGFIELVTYQDEPRHRHVGEINLVATHERFSGQGIGRALMTSVIELADDWLDIVRLGLIVFVDNPRAIELYERLGFEIEGTLRGYGFKRGELVDAHVMSRLCLRGH